MWGQIIATIAGAVVGGVVKGVTAWNTSVKNAEEYKQAAQDVRSATDKYSGQQGYDKMMQSGINEAYELGTAAANENVADAYVPTGPGATGSGANTNAYQSAKNVGANANQAAQSGFDQGMSMQQARNQALYNANTALAQQKMKQADIDYNAANQAIQEGMNVASNAANTYNSLRRTKNGREID